MNANEVASKISARGKPKAKRAGHGQWVAPAQAVYKLVGQQWNVSEAVREVVKTFKFRDQTAAFRGVRAAYYVIRLRRGDPSLEFDI